MRWYYTVFPFLKKNKRSNQRKTFRLALRLAHAFLIEKPLELFQPTLFLETVWFHMTKGHAESDGRPEAAAAGFSFRSKIRSGIRLHQLRVTGLKDRVGFFQPRMVGNAGNFRPVVSAHGDVLRFGTVQQSRSQIDRVRRFE